ncbi:L-type lectin-domain containing receptor kinase IX.1-like [Rosa rugosa]|uniref:L-type lectin-domain containing receptor kinase IX.1-like n=1 Tax=Rosa rugosa TaxID=74645 RepID=UPI002B417C05|nr:L-type lectin-domain containing receptor kinase IX.1-like [Rosa rugosa]
MMSESRSSSTQAICLCNIFFLIIFINFFSHFAHPLSFSIDQFDQSGNGVVCEGDAKFSSGVIELNTATNVGSTGHATYEEPLHLWDTATGSLADFTTHFTFVVDSGYSNFSDGFAFYLAPVGYGIPPNSGGGELGLFNTTTNFNLFSRNKIVTVEFDTWGDKDDGWDPAWPHIGININEISSVMYANWNASNIIGKIGNAWITYNATANNLTVFWTFKENTNPVFPGNTTSSLTYHVDLRKILPENVTIGFSASSRYLYGLYSLNSWAFNSTLLDNDIRRAESKGKKKILLILVIAVPGFILTLGAVIFWLMVLWNRRNKYSAEVSDLDWLAFPKRFAYQELFAATNGFADDRSLGQGGSGQVYKGLLQDLGGCTVAVKRIFARSDQQDEKVFINEVKIISRLIHRNLVQFIGWCHEQGECLLVYAYMPNTSLDTHLFGNRTTLQWDNRYKIALGLASALHYLHEDAEQCVLHRDIKPANVLLDDDFSTKLGDFGIAKLVDPRLRSQTRGVVGTFGYMAPEYATEGRASKESDMFSFGVLALEIACGRKTYQDGEYHVPLFRWVWQLFLAGNILDAADERLEMNYDRNEIKCLLIVGLWCTHPNNKERPKAGQVMKVIQHEAPLPELPHDMHNDPELPQPQYQSQIASSQISSTSSSYI